MHVRVVPYRLRFKRPFGTAHGLREGTDSVFVRMEHRGSVGYGEATLPPYVLEDQAGVIKSIQSIGHQMIDEFDLKSFSGALDACLDPVGRPATRAAIHMAYIDLLSKALGVRVVDLIEVPEGPLGKAIYTLGISNIDDIDEKLIEMNGSPVLKVKLSGSPRDGEVLRRLQGATDRLFLLDANQALRQVDQALELIDVAGGPGRVVGMEQPFAKDDLERHADLKACGTVPVIADESVQGPEDQVERSGAFSGINIKLMKCGGLDRALVMAQRARADGQLVMLGSMSESSLGCAAMAALSGLADLCDLDGPWLVANDPFRGMVLEDGCYRVTGDVGIGVVPVDAGFLASFGT